MLSYFAQGKTLRADISLLFLARIHVEFGGSGGGESCYYFDRAKSYLDDKWNPARAGMQSYSRNRRARLAKARIHPAPN